MMSLTFGLFNQVSGLGPLGPLVYVMGKALSGLLSCPCDRSCSFYNLPVVMYRKSYCTTLVLVVAFL